MFAAYIMAVSISSGICAADSKEIEISAAKISICGRPAPTDAERLAAEHFANEYKRFTGKNATIIWSDRSVETGTAIILANRVTSADLFRKYKWSKQIELTEEDLLNQSYVIQTDGISSDNPVIMVAGYGRKTTPRGSLGISYGLAELIKSLNKSDGKWVFELPKDPIVKTPASKHRMLYTGKIIDEAIDAGFDQIQLGNFFSPSMYNRDDPKEYANITQSLREQKELIALSKRRGLEVCMYLLPPYVRPEVLLKYVDLQGEGFYNQKPGHGGLCWSKPQARDLIKTYVREKMEYFGDVDIYTVWFYDPGGCFCKDCKPNQAKNIYEQLILVDEIASVINPKARIEAVLWPTWCFHQYQDKGIPFTSEEVEVFVKDFLARCAAKYPDRKLTIVDSCESDLSNIYNGYVDPKLFQRNAFMYSTMGMPGELAYRFPPLRFRYLYDWMTLAKKRDVESGTLYLAGWLTPTVYAYGDIMYNNNKDWQTVIKNYARLNAKGDIYEVYVDFLNTLEETDIENDYGKIDEKLTKAEELWTKVDSSPDFYGDRDWHKGFMLAQRSYLEMARAKDEATFNKWLANYKTKLGEIPEYSDYSKAMSPQLVVNLHLSNYWRGPAGDKSTIGLGEIKSESGKVDPLTGDKTNK